MKVRPLSQAEAMKSFAHRTGTRLGDLRQLATRFGIRPFRVFLVHTKFTGPERGQGTETEVRRVELLPTPLVKSLDNVALSPSGAGIIKVGDVGLSEISTRYTYDDLSGTSFPVLHESEVPEQYSFFYELVEDGRDGNPNPPRWKYRAISEPFRDADNVQWVIKLTKISEDRTATGGSTNIGGR